MPSNPPQVGPARAALAALVATPIPAVSNDNYGPASTRFGRIAAALGTIAARLHEALQAIEAIPSGDLGTAMLLVAVFRANVKAAKQLAEANQEEAILAKEKLAENM
jgi:hypothetical protein